MSSPDLHPEAGTYSHVRTAGPELVFVSGQVPLRPDGRLIGDDAASQAAQAMDNLVAALDLADAKPSDVVKLTTFVTDAAVATAVAEARAAHFCEPYPTSTVVVVAGLLSPDWLVEVEAVAQLSRR